MTDRKIIQIATSTPANSVQNKIMMPSVFALCNDGSVWINIATNSSFGSWSRLPDIPQDPAKKLDLQTAPEQPPKALNAITRPEPGAYVLISEEIANPPLSIDERSATCRLIDTAPKLLHALTRLTAWATYHTKPTDANSPHHILVDAAAAIAETKA